MLSLGFLNLYFDSFFGFGFFFFSDCSSGSFASLVSVIFCCELMCSCHDLHACMCAEALFVTPGTVVHQSPLSMGFSRQEHWSGLPCPPPGDLPNPGIEPTSPVAPALHLNSSPLSHWGSLHGHPERPGFFEVLLLQ